jgi:UrcA family protein
MLTSIRTAALALVLAAIASAATAQKFDRRLGDPTNYSPVSRELRVSARGLNLSDERDASVFVQRLTAAITRVCDDRREVSAMTVARTRTFQACRSSALRQAFEKISSPTVRRRFVEDHLEVRLALR